MKIIITEHIYPPIPDRRYDWLAYRENSDPETGSQGWGRTKEDAIEELKIAEYENI